LRQWSSQEFHANCFCDYLIDTNYPVGQQGLLWHKLADFAHHPFWEVGELAENPEGGRIRMHPTDGVLVGGMEAHKDNGGSEASEDW
jgi:hypothetical protein